MEFNEKNIGIGEENKISSDVTDNEVISDDEKEFAKKYSKSMEKQESDLFPAEEKEKSDKIKDTLWTQPEIFEIYEEARKIYRPLNKKIVEETLNEYVNEKDEHIVEVGSGVGEMSKMVPEDIEKRMIHTERNPDFSKIHKERGGEVEVADADVEKLPFKDESADVVAGYAMFDTLFNSEKSAEEIKRILKKDGKFIHFLDLEHNADVLIEDHKKQGEIVFPIIERAIHDYESYCFFSKKEIEGALEKMGEKDPFYKIIKDYIEEPEEYYHIWNMVRPSFFRNIIRKINEEGVSFKSFDPNLYLQKKMGVMFEGLDFEILKNEIAVKKERVKRDERFSSEPEYYNSFMNRIGRVAKMERDVPKGEVDIEAFMHVFVAQKK